MLTTLERPVAIAAGQYREKPLTPIDDALTRIGQSQDRHAFLNLTRLAAPRLKGWVMRSIPDEARAEEIVQDVLITVWRRAGTFDAARGSGWAWLFTLARNRVIDVLRRSRFSEPDPGDPTWTPSAPVAPDVAAGAARSCTVVRAALAELPEDQRAVLEMAYFESMSFAEISANQGISLGTAKSRARLGMERLRAKLLGPEAA